MPETIKTLSLETIETLSAFLASMIELLQVIEQSSPILFRSQFQINYRNSLEEALPMLESLIGETCIQYPDECPEMSQSGLNGNQLKLKLESFENSYLELKQGGGLDNLEQVLDKGSTILNSLAGAIPGFGSFAQELIDFIIKELKRRFKIWKR
ncbi:hypothetical protein [Sulfurirhabdus autotrophica]|uniref:Uncharacterized protein n=1 Tax=Sulfurirhabdus autotrophica TaxID=1706046 RepID=A0A4R3Y8M7_9PROT|nr:hypothetical protein [Sulfurirhabdus autotrophica]TCV86663.1 hypothetical protein EDC63_10624 [Sulfurirhabdus autotrophica]